MSLEEQSQIAQSHIYSYLTTDTHRYLSEDATNKASPTVPHPSVAAVGLEDHGIAHAQEVHPADRNAENSVEPANDNTSRKPDERDVRDLRPLFPLQPEENLQVLPAGLTLENADPTPLPPPDPEISLEADGLHFSSDAIKHQGRSRSPVKDTIPTKRVVSETIAADNGVLETGLLNADRANQSGTFDGEPQVIDVLDNNPAAAPSSILDLADTTSGPKALETKDYDQASYRGLVHEHRRTESGDTSAVDASSRCCKSTASSRSDDCSGGTDFDHASTPNDTDATSLRSRCSQSPPGNDLSSEVILDINAGEGLNLGHQLALNDTLLPSSKPLLTPGEYTPAHASTAAGVDDQDFGNASTVWRRQDYSSPHLLPNTDVLAPVFLPQPPQSFAAQPGQPAAAVPIQVEDEWDSDSAFNEDSQSYTTSLKSSVTRYEYENGRRYHAADGDSWHFLPNDEPEHERLDLFHHVLHLRCDSRLHLAPICENPHRILDLGTGTGIWAIQMAEKYESASVLGNDLSPIQPDLVPPNLSFEVDDMEKEWCYNTPFDYIHCRYLAGALRDWPKLMQQAYKYLKPGGWVEFQDFTMQFYSTDGSYENSARLSEDQWPVPTPSLTRWTSEIVEGIKSLGLEPEPGPKLETWVREAGFINVAHHLLPIPVGDWPKDKKLKQIGKADLLQFLDGLDAISLRVFTTTRGWKPEEVQVLLADVRRTLKDRGVHAQHDFHVVYGQRPWNS